MVKSTPDVRANSQGCTMHYDSEHDFTITMLRDIANEVVGDNSDLSQTMKDVVDQYETFRETMRNKLAQKAQDEETQKTQKQYADLMNSANGLPAMVKGIASVVQTAKSGDSMSISIATVELGATLAKTVGSVVGAFATLGGPAGVLVGALFSAISTILQMFLEPPVPLKDQIEQLMRSLHSEEKLAQVKSAMQSLDVLDTILTNYRGAMSTGGSGLINVGLNLVEGNTITAMRIVEHWLMEPANQETKYWIDILQTRLEAFATLSRCIATYVTLPPDNKQSDSETFVSIVTRARAAVFGQELNFIRGIMPAARNNGWFWHLGDQNWPVLYVRKVVRALPGSDRRGYTSLERPDGELVSFTASVYGGKGGTGGNPIIGVFGLRNDGIVEFRTGALGRMTPWARLDEKNLPKLRSVFAMPGGESKIHLFGTATDPMAADRSFYGVWDYERGVTYAPRLYYSPFGYQFQQVFCVQRALTMPGDTSNAPFAGGQVVYASATVAGGRSGLKSLAPRGQDSMDLSSEHSEILVRFANGKERYFLTAFTKISGIGVDSRHLWVWNDNGTKFVCYPHTSVYACITGEKLRADCAEGPQTEPLLKPFVSLDGEVSALRHGKMVLIAPEIDWTKRRITFPFRSENDAYARRREVENWTEIDDANGKLAQKTPLSCWPLLDGLRNALTIAP